MCVSIPDIDTLKCDFDQHARDQSPLSNTTRPMNTPSHFLMTAALRKALPRLSMSRSAVLLGSIAPDIPLYLLSFGGLFYFHYIEGRPLEDAARHIYGTLYFEDPFWIACHNLLHSPLSLALGFVVVCWARGWNLSPPDLSTLGQDPIEPAESSAASESSRNAVADWLYWFLLACGLHSFIDVLTHFDDGPLLLWPLNWSLRFASPVSYWDPAHYGTLFAPFELLLVVALTGYLMLPWLRSRIAGRGAKPQSLSDAVAFEAED